MAVRKTCQAGSALSACVPIVVGGSPEPGGEGMTAAIWTPPRVTKKDRSCRSITVISAPLLACLATEEMLPPDSVMLIDPATDGFPTTWQNQRSDSVPASASVATSYVLMPASVSSVPAAMVASTWAVAGAQTRSARIVADRPAFASSEDRRGFPLRAMYMFRVPSEARDPRHDAGARRRHRSRSEVVTGIPATREKSRSRHDARPCDSERVRFARDPRHAVSAPDAGQMD